MKEIRKMLDDCAPGAEIIEKKHHQWVTWRGRTYRTLPRAGHGKLEIHRLHVNKMARHLELDSDCVARHIP